MLVNDSLVGINRRYVDLIVDRTVTSTRTRTVVDRVAEHRIYRHTRVAIYLIIDRARRACTYVLAYGTRRYRIYRQVQLVVLGDRSVKSCLDVFPTTGGIVVLSVNIPSER